MSVFMAYKKDGAKYLTPIRTREEYLAHRNTAAQRMILGKVRKGNEKMKNSLVQMVYSCLPNDDGTLRGSKRISNTVGMDIDHIPAEQMEPIKKRILEKKDELGIYMVEVSARGEGYHLAFRRRPELTQEENLKWASEVLGVKYDDGAKDITRVFFTTTEKELVYLDDEIFKSEELGVRSEELGVRSEELGVRSEELKEKSSNSQILDNNNYQSSIVNCQLDSRIRYIAQQVMKEKNLSKSVFLDIGGRHTAVKVFLTTATQLLNKGEINGVLQELMPEHWNDKNIQQLVDDFYKNYTNPNKPLTKFQEGVFTSSQKLKEQETGGEEKEVNEMAVPPVMPAKLPKLIEVLTKNVPNIYKPAVANAVFPALAAHLHGVKFRYWDNVEHEATFMNVLIGRQSSGKGSIKKPIEYIMEDIRLRDIPNRQREAEWKQKNPGSKQKKDPRPTDICIQMLIDNLTDAVFNQRIVDANNNGERYIYTIVDEVEALKKVTSKGTADEVGLLIRKAFDNSLAGQERVGADSVSGIAPLRWNFNASTTPPNARRFFRKMVNDGTVSRLDISTIISKNDDDDEEIVQGIYDDSFAKEIKPYIERLSAANGMIECPQAQKLSLEIKQENREAAKLYESEAYRVFSYRANVIAWLKGMLLYIAHGYKWSKEIADFVRWSQQYNLWCKMLYFGQQLEYELREEIDIQRQSGPQNMLDLLPDTFTREQYYRMRQSQKRSGNGNTTLRVWQTRGYITQEEDGNRFSKTEKYKHKGLS